VFRKLWGLVTDPQNLRIALCACRPQPRTTNGRRRRGHRLPAREEGQSTRFYQRGTSGAALRHVPSQRCTTRDDPKIGAARESIAPWDTDGEGPSGTGRAEEHPRAGVRGGFLSDFLWISSRTICARGARTTSLFLRPHVARSRRQHQLTYQWAIEGDIKGCFDNIDHHALMNRLRRRSGDLKVNRLITAFLKPAFFRAAIHSVGRRKLPKVAILSPLLSNIALTVIDERYERHVWPRTASAAWTDTIPTTGANRGPSYCAALICAGSGSRSWSRPIRG